MNHRGTEDTEKNRWAANFWLLVLVFPVVLFVAFVVGVIALWMETDR